MSIEHKRQVDLSVLIPTADALAVFVGIMERTQRILHDRLEDPQQARKIMSEIARSVHDRLPGPAGHRQRVSGLRNAV